jgi:hypothetical protein
MKAERGEDAPELTLASGLVIGVVCLCGGTAAVLGIGAFATALLTAGQPYSWELFALSTGCVVAGVIGLTAYFLAGGRDGAVRGHEPFESILYWVSAGAVAGIALAVLGVGLRSLLAR